MLAKPGRVAAAAVAATLAMACASGAALAATGSDSPAKDEASAEAAGVASLPETFDASVDCTVCHTAQAAVSQDEEETAQDEAGAPQAEATQAVAPQAGETSQAENAPQTASDASDKDASADSDEAAQLHPAVGCTTCHVADEWLTDAHDGYLEAKRMPKRLKYTTVKSEQCLSCHGSWEALAEETEDVTACTDDLGTVVNPHAAPDSHIGEGGQLDCTDCHTIHEAQTAEQLDEAAAKACQSCRHNNEYIACTECHSGS